MARVVIIGAGLTGLSTAYHLEQQGFFDYALFEQELSIGGLCRSVRADGFTFDYTGHFFHCPCQNTMQFLHGTMQSSKLSSHMRRSYIYSQNTYTPYPYQTNLYGLPTETIIDCITGFVQKQTNKKTGNFSSWVNTHFGVGFAKHFFSPYQEKIFDYPITKLRTGWVQGVPHTTLEDILKGALQGRDIHSIGYNAQFWYPQAGGIDHLVHTFGNALKNRPYTDCSAVYIDPINKIVTFGNGHKEPYEHLISTMPLNCCLNLVGMPYEAKKLLCNKVININLGINCPDLINKHWVYYPEKQYPFFRIGFPHTLNSMAPEGCSSLSIEIATIKDPPAWKIDDLTKQALGHVKKIFNISDRNIITKQILLLPHAYVIYDTWREKHIDQLLVYLENQSIHSIGRYGAWKYSSMYDAIEDGQLAAQKLINQCLASFKPAQLVRQDSSQATPTTQQFPNQIKETPS